MDISVNDGDEVEIKWACKMKNIRCWLKGNEFGIVDVCEKAIYLISKQSDPLKKICSSSCYWMPLQWLYERLRENKDITPISNLPLETKLNYWTIVSKERPDKDKFIKKMICQALHCYEVVRDG